MHHGHGSGWLSPDSVKQASLPSDASQQGYAVVWASPYPSCLDGYSCM